MGQWIHEKRLLPFLNETKRMTDLGMAGESTGLGFASFLFVSFFLSSWLCQWLRILLFVSFTQESLSKETGAVNAALLTLGVRSFF